MKVKLFNIELEEPDYRMRDTIVEIGRLNPKKLDVEDLNELVDDFPYPIKSCDLKVVFSLSDFLKDIVFGIEE